MKKITIIYDSLVKKEYFQEVFKDNKLTSKYSVTYYPWQASLSKSEFQEQIDLIEKYGPNQFKPDSELLQILADTDILLLHIAPVNKEMLKACHKLQVIGLCRGGTENIDLETCKKLDIPVIRMVKNAQSTAEFTLGLMLDLSRNISKSSQLLNNGIWQKNFYNNGFRYNLKDMTVGIIGLGNIGQILAKLLLAIGVQVKAYHPHLSQEKKDSINLPLTYSSLDEVLSSSDIISLHLRVTPETQNIINQETLSKMKPNALLINTARAALVNEADLLNCLRQGQIAGAALDVFWDEPITKDHPLIAMDNVVLTSHIAGDTDVIDRAPKMLWDQIAEFLNGGHPTMLIKSKYMKNTWNRQN